MTAGLGHNKEANHDRLIINSYFLTCGLPCWHSMASCLERGTNDQIHSKGPTGNH